MLYIFIYLKVAPAALRIPSGDSGNVKWSLLVFHQNWKWRLYDFVWHSSAWGSPVGPPSSVSLTLTRSSFPGVDDMGVWSHEGHMDQEEHTTFDGSSPDTGLASGEVPTSVSTRYCLQMTILHVPYNRTSQCLSPAAPLCMVHLLEASPEVLLVIISFSWIEWPDMMQQTPIKASGWMGRPYQAYKRMALLLLHLTLRCWSCCQTAGAWGMMVLFHIIPVL